MNIIQRKIKTFKSVKRPVWRWIAKQSFFKYVPDKTAVKILYANVFNEKLNLKNPKTYNEKLNWMKLYDRNPLYATLVDKAEVKKYVAEIIGEEYIIPTFGVYDTWDKIDFASLPNEFVIKCTHGSGDVVICKDKSNFDFESAKAKITKSLKKNYYKVCREWAYKNVKPRIIIEKYVDEIGSKSLKDFKFYTFNGKCELLLLVSDRGVVNSCVKMDFFDINLNWLPIKKSHINFYNDKKFARPLNYEKMIEIAEKLSKNFVHLRVDLYNANGKIYFGELTFYPAGGMDPFEPKIWDEKIGDLLILPKKQ